MPGELADLSQLGARRLRGAALDASARPLPLERDLFGNKSLHGIGHIGKPGAAAQLTIGKDVEPDASLLRERGQDRADLRWRAALPTGFVPAACADRAASNSGGRNRLPTCSAR